MPENTKISEKTDTGRSRSSGELQTSLATQCDPQVVSKGSIHNLERLRDFGLNRDAPEAIQTRKINVVFMKMYD